MTTTNIADLKNNLSDILRRVEQGEEIAIARRNAPFATIKPLARRQRNRTQLGCLAGSVVVCGDLTEPAVANSDWDMHQG